MSFKGLEPLDEVWRQVSNISPKLEPVLKDAKRRVLGTLLTSEFTILTRLLARIAGGHYADAAPHGLPHLHGVSEGCNGHGQSLARAREPVAPQRNQALINGIPARLFSNSRSGNSITW